MKKRRSIGSIFSGVFTALLAALLLCSVYSIAARKITGKQYAPVFGWSSAVVISGSMSGAIEIDDLVIIHRQNEYAVEDIINFESGDSLVTHRIVTVTDEGYFTKGDANNAPDRDIVPAEAVVGEVVAVIPGVGKGIAFARTPLGMLCIVLIGYAMITVPSALERRNEERHKGGEQDETNPRG